MAGRPGLLGITVEAQQHATVAANGGLWTLGFKSLVISVSKSAKCLEV